MAGSKSRISRNVIILFLLMGCILISGSAWGLSLLKNHADKDFGPASASLSLFNQYYYAARLYLNKTALLEPVNPQGQPQPFKVGSGEPVNVIALNLENAGLIPDAAAFRLYLIYAGLDTGIKAGNYELSPALNAVEIAHNLQNSALSVVPFNILAGWRLEEISAALPTSGLQIQPDDFLSAARDPGNFGIQLPVHSAKSLEGFLYPDSYQFKRDISLQDFLSSMVGHFNNQLTPELRQAYQREKLSVLQAVTLASIVQREAMVESEQPFIASVFLNRLAAGMKLESDPTVQYAIGYNAEKNTWWTNPLSSAQLGIKSPYNTYVISGLPPGPICNPSLSALQAVAYPAKTPYYYFRATCDGSGKHNFSQTFSEQLQNACP
ncbi:MAG TPA: endolytic transglycosylase MltG [Anaerolineaceae bacterium]|nr:endolytic transglycosylase MltG [Anaerolineaceae bacterium]